MQRKRWGEVGLGDMDGLTTLAGCLDSNGILETDEASDEVFGGHTPGRDVVRMRKESEASHDHAPRR